MKHVVSFSGGKDSTAMLLMMIERKMHIDEIIFCDTGMEFPQTYAHIKKVESYTDRKITILKAEHSFEYYLSRIKKEKGKHKGERGYGWPGHIFRWCTNVFKVRVTRKYLKNEEHILYLGLAVDEQKRLGLKVNKKINYRFPLAEWNVTEKKALQFCYDKGFNWGGLYDKFPRVSCWCCPLQRLGSLRTLRKDFPELWKELRRLDKLSYRQYKSCYSVEDLENKFAAADDKERRFRLAKL